MFIRAAIRNVRVIIVVESKSKYVESEIYVSLFTGIIKSERRAIHVNERVIEFHAGFLGIHRLIAITVKGRANKKILTSYILYFYI